MTNSLLGFPLPEAAFALAGAATLGATCSLPLPLSGTACGFGSGPIGSSAGLVSGSGDSAGSAWCCGRGPVSAAEDDPGVCCGNWSGSERSLLGSSPSIVWNSS